MKKLTEAEYAALAERYEKNPPKLSGKAGHLTKLRERLLVNELLDPEYARIVNAKASALSVSPSEVIRAAIKRQLV